MFLEKRAVALEATMKEEPQKPGRSVVSAAAATGVSCKFCHDCHKIYECVKFKMLPAHERFDFVESNSLCKLCFNHHRGRCMLKLKCATCHQLHNTLLHNLPAKGKVTNTAHVDIPTQGGPGVTKKSTVEMERLPAKLSSLVANVSAKPQAHSVLLPTAMVKLMKKDGTFTMLEHC
jgi:hypothetical protein